MNNYSQQFYSQKIVFINKVWINGLFALLIMFCSQVGYGQKDISGKWSTQKRVNYLVEYTDEHPHGESIDHPHIEILERSATMDWDLTMREDGLITGVNKWIAYDENGKIVFEGTEPLLGAFDGKKRIILSEPEDPESLTAQIVFECSLKGKNKMEVLAYSIGGPKLLAMRFELTR